MLLAPHRHLECIGDNKAHSDHNIPVAEGRPGDVLLAAAEHAHAAAPERLRAVVDDVPGVVEEGGALPQLQSDHALVREVGDLEPVGGVVIPAALWRVGSMALK